MLSIKHFIIVLTVVVYVNSITLNLQTNCNIDQFVNLENLIGSIHKYAPKHVHIFVRDMGLSDGQRLLLEQYQNVQIISSTDIISERTQFIDVDKELVLIDGKYNIQPNNGKLLYVDSIRKKYQLAIVIPFIRSQLSNVIVQLGMSKIYHPCKNSTQSVDLIFYHNEGEQSSLESDIRKIDYIDKCYRKVRYLSINLENEENWYPLGCFLMWHKLLDNENNRLSLRSYGYTHFFLMEPDTKPIREFWLDNIIDQITDGRNNEEYISTNWWISGSVYRGTKIIGQRFLHINGNALYHLSASFIQFIQIFSHYYLTGDNPHIGYDLVIYTMLLDNPDLGKKYLHKFRFSDFIQNCWHTGCEGSNQLNNTYFILNNPDTYLIHGNFVKEEEKEIPIIKQQSNDIKKKDSNKLQLIILFLILLPCFVWFWNILLNSRPLYRTLIFNRILKFCLIRKENVKDQHA